MFQYRVIHPDVTLPHRIPLISMIKNEHHSTVLQGQCLKVGYTMGLQVRSTGSDISCNTLDEIMIGRVSIAGLTRHVVSVPQEYTKSTCWRSTTAHGSSLN